MSGSGSVFDAAVAVLKETKKPLSPQDICKLAIEKNLYRTQGKTPQNTFSSIITQHINKNPNHTPFLRVSNGLYIHRDYKQAAGIESENEADPNPAPKTSKIRRGPRHRAASRSPSPSPIIRKSSRVRKTSTRKQFFLKALPSQDHDHPSFSETPIPEPFVATETFSSRKRSWSTAEVESTTMATSNGHSTTEELGSGLSMLLEADDVISVDFTHPSAETTIGSQSPSAADVNKLHPSFRVVRRKLQPLSVSVPESNHIPVNGVYSPNFNSGAATSPAMAVHPVPAASPSPVWSAEEPTDSALPSSSPTIPISCPENPARALEQQQPDQPLSGLHTSSLFPELSTSLDHQPSCAQPSRDFTFDLFSFSAVEKVDTSRLIYATEDNFFAIHNHSDDCGSSPLSNSENLALTFSYPSTACSSQPISPDYFHFGTQPSAQTSAGGGGGESYCPSPKLQVLQNEECPSFIDHLPHLTRAFNVSLLSSDYDDSMPSNSLKSAFFQFDDESSSHRDF